MRTPASQADDDELVITKAKSDGKSGQRFLDSALNLLNIQ